MCLCYLIKHAYMKDCCPTTHTLYIYIYIYIYTHTHTHIHIYIYTHTQRVIFFCFVFSPHIHQRDVKILMLASANSPIKGFPQIQFPISKEPYQQKYD